MKNRAVRVGVASAILALLTVTTLAQPRRLLTPQDILRVATVSDAQISPNGAWVVYTVSTTADDKTINTLWLASAGSGSVSYAAPITPGRRVPYVDWSELRTSPTPLLASGWNASTPRWGSFAPSATAPSTPASRRWSRTAG